MRLVCCILLFLCFGPVVAQSDPPDYPTLTALEQTVVPLSDPAALAQRFRGVEVIPTPLAHVSARQVGERQVFWANNTAASMEFQVMATLRVVGDHIYLWVQDGEPILDEELQRLADAFDTLIYPAVRGLWGSEAIPGIDGDARIYGLFARNLGTGTLAYFSGRNTYPPQVFPTSNGHEMFFFNVDATGTTMLDTLDMESTIAHEFQHMIRSNVQENEAVWLNEGFSTFTQLHLYDDLSYISQFQSRPQTQLNTWGDTDTIPHYGAAKLFITYFYDRFGLEALQQLSADPGTGLDAFDTVLRERGAAEVDSFFADWVLANLLLDPTLTAGGYGYTSFAATRVPAPSPRVTISEYPYQHAGYSNQYATDYLKLTGLEGKPSLQIDYEALPDAQLVPVGAASGTWMWYSNRGDQSHTMLTRAFDLSGVQQATLQYRIWYQTEPFYDYGYVTLSADGGQTWTVLEAPRSMLDDPLNSAYGPGYTGDSGGWLDEQISLDAYAGHSILLRFEMITDEAKNQPGVTLDDVRIPEIGYATDFENEDDGWIAEGWVRTDNRLPQRTWVQAVQYTDAAVTINRWLVEAGERLIETLPLDPAVKQVVLVVSPFAPVTTVATAYQLHVSTP